MAGRWRTWDFDCLEETLVCRPKEEEVEPLVLAGSLKEIPFFSLSSIVLPKEALTTPCDDDSVRSRGRGRSLANRALGFDKPSRRPGEREYSDKGTPKFGRIPKSILASQFLESDYLYEENFPSLDQSAIKTDAKASVSVKSSWGSIPKNERPSQLTEKYAEKQNEENSILEKSEETYKSDKTDVFNTSEDGEIPTKCTDISNNNTSGNDEVKVDDQLLEKSETEDVQNSNQKDFVQEKDWTESEDDNKLFPQGDNGEVYEDKLGPDNNQDRKDYLEDDGWIENKNGDELFQENDNEETAICDQLSANPNEETSVDEDTKPVEILQFSDTEATEHENYIVENGNSDLKQLVENKTAKDSSFANDSEVEKHIELIDSKDNLDVSLDMSTSDVDNDPCNILLENLHLALTEEALQEIVEPYGEMVSYEFQEKDDTSKICIVRMPSSSSGELLVVSLDGLEVDGHRITATMDNS